MRAESFGTPTYVVNGTTLEIEPGAAFQELGAGQSATIDIAYTVTDFDGSSASGDVLVTITGVNEAPVVASTDKTESAALQLGNGTETASGAVHFTDVDFPDRPTGSATATSLTYTDANGHALALTSGEISAIEGAFSVANPGANTNNGEVDWTFSIADSALAFLTHGQTITLTETITVDDHNGGTDTSTETVTITGPNHPPMFTSAPETADIIDGQSLQTPPNLVTNGGFESGTGGWTYSNFLYPPTTGSGTAHSGSDAVAVATYPSTNLGTISQTITDQAGATYTVELFAIPASGESSVSTDNTLSIDWDGTSVASWTKVPSITGADPTSSSQYVEYTATVTGTGSDALGIVLGTGYYWYVDDISVSLVTTPGTEHQAGAIAFTDVDLGDTHTVTVTPGGAGYLGTFTTTTVDSTGTGSGAVDWSFSVADSAMQSIAAQQTVVQTYTVSIDDHHGGVTQQNVTVDIFNPDHAPNIVMGSTSGAIHSNGDAAVTTTNLIQDGGFESHGNDGLGSSWTESNKSGDVFEDTEPGHSGATALFLWTGTDAPNDVVKVSQVVSNTVAGAAYTLTFFVDNDLGFDPNSSINVLWNNQTVLTLNAIPVSGFENYFEYVANIIGTGTASTLEFDFRSTEAFAFDDVSLVGTPAAATEKTAGTLVFTDADVGDTHHHGGAARRRLCRHLHGDAGHGIDRRQPGHRELELFGRRCVDRRARAVADLRDHHQ